MPDVERLTRKLERRKTTLADLCQLYRASSKLPMIEQALLSYEGPYADLLKTRSAFRLQQMLQILNFLAQSSSPAEVTGFRQRNDVEAQTSCFNISWLPLLH